MTFSVVIPARYESSRIPGKALVDIAGKPMLQHVYERALESGAETVIIATDDERVQEAAEGFGAVVCMTGSEHTSGTERISEVVSTMEFEDDDIVVNVQGDEPLIPPEVIHQVATDLTGHENIKMCTLCQPIKNSSELLDPDVVKVVLNRRGFALYFSRAPIPWERDRFPLEANVDINDNYHYRHIGIYAYRAKFLQEYMDWEPCYLEQMESLEQLRILWHGGRIHAIVAQEKIPPSVDTARDLEFVRQQLA